MFYWAKSRFEQKIVAFFMEYITRTKLKSALIFDHFFLMIHNAP